MTNMIVLRETPQHKKDFSRNFSADGVLLAAAMIFCSKSFLFVWPPPFGDGGGASPSRYVSRPLMFVGDLLRGG